MKLFPVLIDIKSLNLDSILKKNYKGSEEKCVQAHLLLIYY